MWKPGSDKPAAHQQDRTIRTTTANKTAAAVLTSSSSPDSKKRKTELSTGTRNMRFMQRGRAPPGSAFNNKSKNAKLQAADAAPRTMEVDDDQAGTSIHADDVAMASTLDNDEEAESSPDDAAAFVGTPADMYGIEGGIAIGRRSFGGFNGVVAENWFRQQQELFPKTKSSGGKSRQEEHQMLRQFDQLQRDERKSKGKTKRNKNGISNGNQKRTKTLEDIIGKASS